MKICSRCKIEKPYSEFYAKSSAKDGFKSQCKTCANVAIKAWYGKNRDRVIATSATYYANNSEKKKVSSAKWRNANQDKVKKDAALWAKNNPDKVLRKSTKWNKANSQKRKDISAAWQKSHPENMRINNHNYRSRKRINGGILSRNIATKLFKLQRGKCACGCGENLGDNYHLDHIMPIALGGKNEDWNVQLLRQFCNIQKHAKHPIDYMQSKGYLL